MHSFYTSQISDIIYLCRFYFTEQAKISSSAGGESCLLHMLGSLYDAIEKDYGSWAPRLYRAFRPQPGKFH
jgi:ankyrin repeat-rich membrane spanning protein